MICVKTQIKTVKGVSTYTKTIKVLGLTVYYRIETCHDNEDKPIGFSTFPDQRQYIDDDEE